MTFTTDILNKFHKQWALLSAGTPDNFNAMTVSWAGLGTLWNVPVATVYVRTNRYTHEFMDNNDYFTVSFYPESMKKELGVFGSKSGRDINKMNYPGLTPKVAGPSMTYAEAEVTLVCKKLFMQQLDISKMPEDVQEKFYKGDYPHDMYIGEVVDLIQ